MDKRYLIRESMAPPKNEIAADLAYQMNQSKTINMFSQKYPGTPKSKSPTPSFGKQLSIFGRNENNINRSNII